MKQLAAIIVALSAITTASATARPFTDPRADRSDAIDQAAALEPRDPACQARTLVAAGLWSLDEFVAALERMSCLVTNDSGPMHLAAAQGTPIVSLWGPQRPDVYAPRVANQEIVYEAFPCSPCIHMLTTFEGMWCHHEGWCMQAIATMTVLAAVERRLAAGDAPAGAGAVAALRLHRGGATAIPE